jgi:hypothetical protein
MNSGRIIYILRLSRSAERSKRIFTGKAAAENRQLYPQRRCFRRKQALQMLF